MFRYFKPAFMSAVVILSAQAAHAWGPNGHRITAQIAEGTMSGADRINLWAIAGPRGLALMATWPDFVRSFAQYDCFKPWHFLTVEDGQPIEEALKRPPDLSDACDKAAFADLDMPGNVVDAITFFADILKGDKDKAARFSKLMETQNAPLYQGSVDMTALALLVHLVGDVHQPLHVGRGPDRGGNSIDVYWFGEPVVLHEVWDEGLIEKEALSFTEFAVFLVQDLGYDAPANSAPVSWAEESVNLRAKVYDFGDKTKNGLPDLSYSYAAQNDAVFKARLHTGGVRLAALLSEILATR